MVCLDFYIMDTFQQRFSFWMKKRAQLLWPSCFVCQTLPCLCPDDWLSSKLFNAGRWMEREQKEEDAQLLEINPFWQAQFVISKKSILKKNLNRRRVKRKNWQANLSLFHALIYSFQRAQASKHSSWMPATHIEVENFPLNMGQSTSIQWILRLLGL